MVQTSGIPQIGRPELTRRYDVDWLRVLGMMVVFLFHNARFFDTDGWHVKSPRTAPVVMIIVTFAVQWMMPLFFVLSGIGAYHALAHQSWPQYLASRIKRLVVPLVFGIFVIIAPWQVYLERVSHGQYSGSFWSWYPHYFEGWFGLGGNFAWMGVHLWYLEALFVFSLLTLPLFLVLRSRPGDRLMAALSRAMTVPGLIFLLAVPIAIMEFIANSPALRENFGRRDFGGWSLLPYAAIFIVGFLLAGREEMAQVMERHRFAGLVVALLTFVAAYVAVKQRGLPESGIAFAALLGFSPRVLRLRQPTSAVQQRLPEVRQRSRAALLYPASDDHLDRRLLCPGARHPSLDRVPDHRDDLIHRHHGPVRVAHPEDQPPAFPLRPEDVAAPTARL